MTNRPSSVADVDFFHDSALVADPYPMLARMRTESPVLREPTQGVLVVERMRLDDFLVELGRYRPGVLRCDPAVGAILVSGAFPVARTDAVLDMLEETLPVRRRSLGPYWTTIAAR